MCVLKGGLIILTNSIDDKLHFKPEEYAKCLKCLKKYRPDIYEELEMSLNSCECEEFFTLYKTEFYTKLVKYRTFMGERLFNMYHNIFKSLHP